MDLRLLPYQPDRDVYRLLGVPPSAGSAEIAAACRTLARAFHPDRNDSHRATEEMQVVNAVRSLLTDPRSRAEYDRSRLVFWSAAARSVPARPARMPAPARTPAPARPAGATPPARPVSDERTTSSPVVLRPGRPPLTRTARAAMAGLLTALRALPPARCDYCDAWVELDHRFCGACGAALRTAVRASANPSR